MKPDDASLSTIAQQIVDNRAMENMQFWGVYAALVIVLIAIAAIVRTYFSERGKLWAAAATLQSRLDDIRQSTDASEQVKTRIAHSDWTVKELKTLRRNKLEQLTAAAYKLLLASEVDAEFTLEQEHYAITAREFMIDLHQISALYFEEFKAETDAVSQATGRLAVFLIESRSLQRQTDLVMKHEKAKLDAVRSAPGGVINGLTSNAQQAVYDVAREKFMTSKLAHSENYPKHYWPLSKAVDALQARATMLMNELITPTTA